jgi:hypothetical protein
MTLTTASDRACSELSNTADAEQPLTATRTTSTSSARNPSNALAPPNTATPLTEAKRSEQPGFGPTDAASAPQLADSSAPTQSAERADSLTGGGAQSEATRFAAVIWRDGDSTAERSAAAMTIPATIATTLFEITAEILSPIRSEAKGKDASATRGDLLRPMRAKSFKTRSTRTALQRQRQFFLKNRVPARAARPARASESEEVPPSAKTATSHSLITSGRRESAARASMTQGNERT